MDAAIRLEDVRWSIGKTTILEPVNLAFAAEKMNVILGPNGAGKSTLMRIAAGRLKPTGGRVLHGDRDVFGLDARALARQRAFLSQHVEIDFAITVEEVVLMGRYPHFARAPGREDRRIVDAALEMVGMAARRRQIYPTLSGGEQQRVQLARVLAQVWSDETPPPARTIFLDEPIASLDVHHQLQILEIVRGLLARGCTIIVTLHDLNLAMRYGDRLIFLRDGRLHDVVEDPGAVSTDLVRRIFDVRATALDDDGRPMLRFYL
ncbi:ATP-binding cassette domain-containing protein [Novosphingobium album (ex Liu et al. 2023)]|uniref:ATP-binding cassette domain-containing protein n=1 Tax=Novosphingobium album (ex Liu et al. 2023) TaxID=3031130 RepID=A0ABT5WNT0_9SPHN|nr:ATP-binding cassette domain-containing protein [Novosphingobium album (ex Liu et al. 2023)]MDE8651699.1 ATP-binding cassette domain-containing protein [Novosphingobium album (ex Liu et al. 2023)]